MRQQLIFSAALVASAALVGCAKGSGSSNAGGLSSEQEARFQATVDGVGKASDFGASAAKPASEGASIIASSASAEAPSPSRGLEFSADQMKGCAKTFDFPNAPSRSGFRINIGLSGEACPVTFLIEIKQETDASASSGDGKMDGKFQFELKNADSMKEVDVYAFNFGFTGKMKMSPEGKSSTTSGGGEIKSRREGTIKIAISAKESSSKDGAESTTTATLTYPDGMVAELTENTLRSEKGSITTCTLNGKLISHEKCEDTKKKLNLGGGTTSGEPTPATPPAGGTRADRPGRPSRPGQPPAAPGTQPDMPEMPDMPDMPGAGDDSDL